MREKVLASNQQQQQVANNKCYVYFASASIMHQQHSSSDKKWHKSPHNKFKNSNSAKDDHDDDLIKPPEATTTTNAGQAQASRVQFAQNHHHPHNQHKHHHHHHQKRSHKQEDEDEEEAKFHHLITTSNTKAITKLKQQDKQTFSTNPIFMPKALALAFCAAIFCACLLIELATCTNSTQNNNNSTSQINSSFIGLSAVNSTSQKSSASSSSITRESIESSGSIRIVSAQTKTSNSSSSEKEQHQVSPAARRRSISNEREKPIARHQNQHQQQQQQQTHLFKVRSNGRLTMPLLRLTSGPPTLPNFSRSEPELARVEQELRSSPAPTPVEMMRMDVASTELPFGLRAKAQQPSASSTKQPPADEQTRANHNNNHSNNNNKTDCSQHHSSSAAAAAASEQGSISTQSQTLRLSEHSPAASTVTEMGKHERSGELMRAASSSLQPARGPGAEIEDDIEATAGERVHLTTANNDQHATVKTMPLELSSLDSHQTLSSSAQDSTHNEQQQATNKISEQQQSSILSLIDEYDSKIITNRTRAQLSCDSGEMILRLNFSEPFKGIVYPNHNRLSPCRFFGDGHHNYELRLPLRGCGTRQAAPRVFVNDVIVRFHKALELEEDEVKTLICRYPPPLAPAPLDTSTASVGIGGAGAGAGSTPASASSAAGGAHLSAVASNNSNRSATLRPSQQSEQGSVTSIHLNGGNSGEQQETPQFEFVEPSGAGFSLAAPSSGFNKQQTARSKQQQQQLQAFEAGTTGNIETLSENLIVAPSGGLQSNSAYGTSSSSSSSGNAGGGKSSLRQPPADIFNQRNSLVQFNNQPNGGGLGSATSTTFDSSVGAASRPNYFERLSSIELLFLISSLMFLVLLALGLAGSFYCFRRQAAHQSHARASAILRRKRRYLGTGATLVDVAQSPSSQLTLSHQHQHQQQQHYLHHQQAVAMQAAMQQQQHHHHHRNQAPPAPPSAINTAPSSPESSDLSGRTNLLQHQSASNATAAAPGSLGRAYMLNRAYVSDNKLAGTYNTANYGLQHRPNRFAQMKPGVGVQAPAQVHHQTIGRRGDAAFYGYSNYAPPGGAVAGRQQRHLSSPQPNLAPQQQDSSTLMPYLVNHSSTSAAARSHSQALQPTQSSANNCLRFVPDDEHSYQEQQQQLHYPHHHHAHQRRRRHDTFGRHHNQLARAKSLSSVQNNSNNNTNNNENLMEFGERTRASITDLATNDSISAFPGGSTMSRRHPTSQHLQQPNLHYSRQLQFVPELIEATSRFRQPTMFKVKAAHLQANDKSHLRANYVSDTGTSSNKNTNKATLTEPDDEVEAANSQLSSSSSAKSDDVCDEPNNNISELLFREKPKIVLKSIEDSFITNYTEIYEQEYMKRDSMQPLSLNKWRQSVVAAGGAGGRTRATQKCSSSSATSVDNNDDDDDEDDGASATNAGIVMTSDDNHRFTLNQSNNLRSLTELDVNFAKSTLPMQLNKTSAGEQRHRSSSDEQDANEHELVGQNQHQAQMLTRSAKSFEKLTFGSDHTSHAQQEHEGAAAFGDEQNRERMKRSRSNSVPEVGGGLLDLSQPFNEVSAKHAHHQASRSDLGASNRGRVQSPEADLILSPDYDYSRLEFEPSALSHSNKRHQQASHNSVSYV